MAPEAFVRARGGVYLGELEGVAGIHRMGIVPEAAGDRAQRRAQMQRVMEQTAGVRNAAALEKRMRYPRRFEPTDPQFWQQWHIENTGQRGGRAGADGKVRAAWDRGLSGAGVVIGIVDGGTQYRHPDLLANWKAPYARDFNDNDNDPSPGTERADDHGTAVAGISVAASNDLGGLGVAYAAQFIPIRLIAGPVDDGQEAVAMRYGDADIYNNSWGPVQAFSGPGFALEEAVRQGTLNGRGGLGAIYVWAAGNGGLDGENSNYDGYNSLPWTLSVGAIGDDNRVASYSEPGANLLVVAPSRGQGVGIYTTDNTGSDGYGPGDYYGDFSGTSAATPFVSGVVALMLEANPALRWWEVQEILARTADPVDWQRPGWERNAAGLWFHHHYGFGRVNADAATALAAQWPGTAAFRAPLVLNGSGFSLPQSRTVSGSIAVAPAFAVHSAVVEMRSNHSEWGDLRVELVAPSGTRSRLLDVHNSESAAVSSWRFLASNVLGEPSAGTWRLEVTDVGSSGTGSVSGWSLTLYGVDVASGANQHPVGGDLSYDSTQWPIEIDVLAGVTDPDGDAVSILSIDTPEAGDLVPLGDGRYRYTLLQSEGGLDSFSVLIADGRGGVLRRKIAARDPRPAARNDLYFAQIGQPLAFDVLENDIDLNGDALRLTGLSGQRYGNARIEGGKIHYTGQAPGVERIRYTLTDDRDGAAAAWMTVIVEAQPRIALQLDGLDSHLRVESEALELRERFTVSAWINPDHYGEFATGFGRIFDKGNFIVFLNGYDHAFYNSSSLVVYFNLGNGIITAANTPVDSIQLNRWQHIAVSYDPQSLGASVRIYINGQSVPIAYPIEDSSAPRRPITANALIPLLIGESLSGARAYRGHIYRPELYAGVLSADLIAQLYAGQTLASERLLAFDFAAGSDAVVPTTGSSGASAAMVAGALRSPYSAPWAGLEAALQTERDGGNGWWLERNLGWLYGDDWPWVHIPAWGWAYFNDGLAQGQYLFAPVADAGRWWWTDAAAYPQILRLGAQWIYYLEGTGNPAWFHTPAGGWQPFDASTGFQ